ncbi:hypothetical protein [Actinacidiphila acididurans]|uniref:hypothetical protein n=1 Tax=Actinacidiphila acididurans TaxID=2784346 RepID=UPI001F1F3C4F|nr:hypothetical protein [Actinacidiphila acididurans]
MPCNVELLYVLARAGYGAEGLPRAEVVAEWKRAFLEVWEGAIDELEPTSEHRRERLAVLNRTFDQLAEVAAE